MKKNILYSELCIIPLIFFIIFLAGCASIPTLATITQDGKQIDLIVEKKSVDDFLIVKQVIIGADKKQILIISGDNDKIILDYKKGIVNDPEMADQLFIRKGPWYYFEQDPSVHNPTNKSPDGKYFFSREQYGKSLTINESVTGRSIILESGLSRRVATYFSGINDRFVIHFKSGTNDLDFYNLKTFSRIKSYPIPYTKASVFGNYESMSSDGDNEILIFHTARLIQIYNFKTGEFLGNILLLDKKNWFVVSNSGQYDGTTDAINILSWQVGKEKIKLKDFGKDFQVKGLLGLILNQSNIKLAQTSDINITKQLIGKVNKISSNEIIVATGRNSENIHMGDKLFVIIKGKKVFLEVTFPMMTVVKCKISNNNTKLITDITEGMPVFKM